MHCMLQAVRALVSPSISQKERSVCQRRMNQSGLLQQLCTLLMATGIPADVLTECINTVAEVIRGHPDNQVNDWLIQGQQQYAARSLIDVDRLQTMYSVQNKDGMLPVATLM